jgi:hypothetical protein
MFREDPSHTRDATCTTISEPIFINCFICDLLQVKIYYRRYKVTVKSRGCSVGIATGYGLDDQGSGGVRFPAGGGVGIFPFTTVSLGVKMLAREADHPPPRTDEVKNAWHPNTSSWRGVMLSTGTTLPLPCKVTDVKLITPHISLLPDIMFSLYIDKYFK